MNRPVAPLHLVRRVLACLAIAHSSAHAATFDVTNTGDFGPGTLREAIMNANNTPGLDVINFRIPGTGVQRIALRTELPQIYDPVIIDGYSQAGSTRNTLADGFNAVINVFIDGSAVPPSSDPAYTQLYGLTIRKDGSGSRVSGVKVSNFTHGVVLVNATAVVIEGNKVLDNRAAQILATGNANAIGLSGAGMRNLIAGKAEGIILAGDANVVRNNYIGFAESINDTQAVDAASSGIAAYFGTIGVKYASAVISGGSDLLCGKPCGLAFQSNHHQIGGLEGGEGNVVIGQALGGVVTRGASNGDKKSAVMRVDGNRFGASFDGTRSKGFGNFYGVYLNHQGASMIVVQGNAIYDGVAGIVVDGGKTPITGAKLTQNRIVGQTRMAIDLGDNNRDVNDKLDADGGNNNTQNYPVLSGGSPSGGGWRLSSAASQAYTLEFFQSGGTCKNPEADVYLGAYSVTTDAAGDATFSGPLSTLPGGFVTATATDKGGNTSELSDCVAAAKLPSKVAITSWKSPLLFNSWDSRYEMQVSGGLVTPTGRVSLWLVDPFGARMWFGSTALNAGTAIWAGLPSGGNPGARRVQADYEGDSLFDPSSSGIVDLVVYDVKDTFASGTSDLLRAAFSGNAPVPGSYEILTGTDLLSGNTGNWQPLGIASGKTIVAAGKFLFGWGRSTFLASDSLGNMTIEYLESGAFKSLPVTGWGPGVVVEVGRFLGVDQQGIVVQSLPKRFEVRQLPDDYLPQLPVKQQLPLRDETLNPLITSLSIAAVGDFDGDGNDDIIWNVDGTLEMWLMNGSTRIGAPWPLNPPIKGVGSPVVAVTIAGVGDFDGDGRADILWRGGDYYYVTLMNGVNLKEAVAAIPVINVPAEWKIKAVADYDGDGKADLLWRNEGSLAGANAIYLMNGSGQVPANRILAIPQAFLPLTTDFIDP